MSRYNIFLLLFILSVVAAVVFMVTYLNAIFGFVFHIDDHSGADPFELLAKTFPAGTLSGAPKFRAMELIDQYEPTSRGYYGGAIGFAGFDGSFNHAIMIRTFLSQQNRLTCQAGAGVVAASNPENEWQEVNNKLGALKKAIRVAETLK